MFIPLGSRVSVGRPRLVFVILVQYPGLRTVIFACTYTLAPASTSNIIEFWKIHIMIA